MGLKINVLLAVLLAMSQVSLAQPPPPAGCVIVGTSPVVVGDTWTYNISTACPVTTWTATCGSIQSFTSTSVTIYFNVLGSCSSSTITAKNGSGTTLATKTVTVNQPPALVCGSISNPTQTINYNTTPSQINAAASSGGNCGGSYSYQWYSSTNGTTFTAISGATGQNYQPGNLTVTTYFYRMTTCAVQTCTTSNTATVTVYPQLQPGAVSPSSQTINYNTAAGSLSLSGVSGGSGSYTYQWFSSPNGTSYSSISGATSSTYSPGNLTATTYYQCQVSSNGVSANSTAGLATVYPQIQGTVSPATQVVYYGNPCNTLNLGSVSGGNGSYSYQWQSSPDNSTWTNISGITGTSYSPGNVTTLKYYQVIITSNGDPVASSVAWVKPALFAGIIVPDALTITSGTSPGPLNADPASGGSSPGSYSYQWQDSSASTGGLWVNVSGATSQNYTPGTLTSNVWYRRQVSSGSDVANTNECQITVGSASSDFNFVRSRSILKAGITDTATADALTSPFDVAQITEYFDGMGRSIQTVAMQASPLQNDVVSPIVFDNFGRQDIKYMPYVATTSDGKYKPTALVDQENFNAAQFPGEQYYYGQINYEASPQSRVLNSFSPGGSWVGNNIGPSEQYLINTTSDSVQIWSISSAQLSLPINGGRYAAGQLFKTSITDEQGHQTIEYKDKLGKVILNKKQQSTSPSTGHAGWLCTYYVYDTLQHLRVIIQPQAVMLINGTWTINNTIANQLCFRYEYDGRGRTVIRKMPGAGQIWKVYDARDRAVMTQDSLLRSQHKWQFAKYDALNRLDSTGLITDPTYFDSLAHYDTLAYSSTNFPTVSSFTNQLLTQNFYDDYSWVSTYSAPVASSMATNYTTGSNFITTYNSSPTYAVAITPFNINRGMPTGSMKMVLGTSNQYLYTSMFYDDRGRIIQTQTSNYTGSVDTITMQYNFNGTVLRALLNHKKALNTVQNHTIITKMDYDHRFRLRHVYKNIDNAASDQLIDSLQYNELGQLAAKYLGNNVDSLIYTYNIRGWLSGINLNYIAGTTNHYFGMELGYNKTSSIAPGNSYLTSELNGNIEGVVWKSAGSGINRKYDFTYDPANRLTAAAFLQNTTGTTWDKTMIDYSVSGISYDANGNLATMTQRGFTTGGSSPIDSLTYSYLGSDSSNVLMGIQDPANNDSSKLEDFHYTTSTKQSTDYGYDGNGNLTHDNNKKIDTITYNYLNLPTLVHIKGEGNVAFTYDATGSKLLKVITDSVTKHSTTILYVSGFVYQQTDTITNPGGGTDTLQFVSHEEGRARWAYHKYTNGTSAYKFEYDFFEKDHQANTRVVLTQERDTANYIATLEAAYRPTEEQLFGNIDNTSVAWTSMPNYTSIPSGVRFLYGTTNDSVSKVDSSSAGGQKVGPNLLLKVMSGDSVNLSVQCYYTTPGGGSTNYSSFSDVLTSLGQGLVNLTGGAHGTISNLTSSGSSVYTGLSSFLSSDDTAHSGFPKAYINWIFLDDQFNYVSSLSGSVLAASSTYPGNQMNLVAPGSPLALNRNGYLYIWVSNETSGWDVFFDNLSVQHKQGPLLEENHYYPYGLTMAGISDKAIKTQYAENKYRYDGGTELQNKEFSDGSGLELYETTFRSFDPQIGRFFQIDPLADKFQSLTTYQYAGGSPILSNDPTGAYVKFNATYPGGTFNSGISYNGNTDEYNADWEFDGGGGGDGSGGGDSGGGGNGEFSDFLNNIIGTLLASGSGSSWTNDGTGNGTGIYNFSDVAGTDASAGVNSKNNEQDEFPSFPIYGANGLIGYVDVLANNPLTDDGVGRQLILGWTDMGSGYSYTQLNWMQTIVTDAPTSTNPANTPYEDCPMGNCPYYYPVNLLPDYWPGGRFASGSPIPEDFIFGDGPTRDPSTHPSYTWSGSLSLVVPIANSQPSQILFTINWSFTVTPNGVSEPVITPYW